MVANEVKELAQETAKATEDIARRVEAIQGDTAAAVSAIEEISAIVAQISDRQTTIASAVEEQTATTNEMSRSVQEAAGGGTAQIADNITGVSTAADSTTQALTQTRTAVDELSRMAVDLCVAPSDEVTGPARPWSAAWRSRQVDLGGPPPRRPRAAGPAA